MTEETLNLELTRPELHMLPYAVNRRIASEYFDVSTSASKLLRSSTRTASYCVERSRRSWRYRTNLSATKAPRPTRADRLDRFLSYPERDRLNGVRRDKLNRVRTSDDFRRLPTTSNIQA